MRKGLRYSAFTMFDVLVYVYENYWRPDACPAPRQLSRKLSAVGFEPEEIEEALSWLGGLSERAQSGPAQPGAGSLPPSLPLGGDTPRP